MLFSKLYNWLKYKTLPASFLFKNRLFIERDSKHRKIVSNFGLTFRNSKWGNYENINVALDFKNTYFKLILAFLVLCIFFFLIYGSSNFFFNSISFFFWFTIDSFDYYLSFIIWSFFSFISISISKFYFFINKQNYPSDKMSLKKFKIIAESPFNISSIKFQIPQNDLNWILHSWLTSKTREDFYLKKCTELFFDSNVSKEFWDNNYAFYLHLYKAIFFLNLNNNNLYYYSNNLNSYKNYKNYFHTSLFSFFNNTFLAKEYFSIIYSYYYKFNLTNFQNNSYKLSKSIDNSKWTVADLTLENFKLDAVTDSKKGHFFFNEYSFNDLLKNLQESELFFFKNLALQHSTNSSITFSKWNRWLYRYSLLHRKSIKFAQKLTFSKKLMNSGFYNASIFKKNLWNSNFFTNKKLNSSQMTTFFDLYFNDFAMTLKSNIVAQKQQSSFFFKDTNNFLFFKFFENSYFWKLKRLFLFNSLNTNSLLFKLNLKNEFSISNQSFSSNFLLNNLFEKNRNFFLLTLPVFNVNFTNENIPELDLHNLFGIINEDDLFSKENLSVLNSLSSNAGPFFFSEFKPLIRINYKKLSFNNFLTAELKNLNKVQYNFFVNNIIMTKNNNYFFKDLLILSTLLK